MGQSGYVIAEQDSVTITNRKYQDVFQKLQQALIAKCNADWGPRKFGGLTPGSNEYGMTTILPALFDDLSGNVMAHWRQTWTVTGHQTIITGTRTGNTIPEDFKVGWLGMAFPNKNQHITEIKYQIGDRKYGRLDIEEMHLYNKPAIIFEDGIIIDEEEAFDLYAYIEPGFGSALPLNGPGGVANTIYQRVVLLGLAMYNVKSKVLGNCGAAIP